MLALALLGSSPRAWAQTAPNDDEGALPPEALPPAPPQPAACPPGLMPAPATAPTAELPPPAPLPPQPRYRAFSPNQMALSVGGGAANFVRDRIADNGSLGGAWDVRVLFGTRSWI